MSSTYFVLLTSDFYNVFSRSSRDMLREIIQCGHEIGLHFDELSYPEIQGDTVAIREKILMEAHLLEKAIEAPVSVVSMHRPSKNILEANLDIPGMVNSYGKVFFHDFKYLSDSRRHWREPVEEIIKSGCYNRLHILTHAFWYGQEERNITDTVREFILSANRERYDVLLENITDLESIVKRGDINL